MATAVENENAHDDHHGHDHGEFIAHHFESPEQQFDSGKLGMWLFLVQEILFFSGLFVAYTLYRYHNPDVFMDAHIYLNKTLGAINTIVLLFSSFTMAWAVRCSQVEDKKGLIINTVITLVCAAVFLGVKAVEYSHKWSMGLFWAGAFTGEATGTSSGTYIFILSLPFILALIAFVALALFNKISGSEQVWKFHAYMALTCGGYFLGLVLGMVIEGMSSHHGEGHHAMKGDSQLIVLLADDGDEEKAGDTEKGHDDDGDHNHSADEDGEHAEVADHDGEHTQHGPNAPRKELGNFFSIYYFMTGLHAVHIIAGIVALAWLLWRALHFHFRKDYFGPVENVGLYWHLVDLVWIFLFPLMYLIN